MVLLALPFKHQANCLHLLLSCQAVVARAPPTPTCLPLASTVLAAAAWSLSQPAAVAVAWA